MSSSPPGPPSGPDLFAQVAVLGDQILRLRRHRNIVHDGVVLENSAFRLLWALAPGEPLSLRQLAGHLDLEQSTINRQANAAIDAGYLERFEVEGSASRLLRATSAGRAAYEHDGVIRAARYQRVLAELGAEAAQSLVEHLTAFNDVWDAALAPGDQDRRSHPGG